MKGIRAYRIRAITVLALAFLPSSLLGQDITGEWSGVLEVQEGGNPHVVIRELPGLNHMFQEIESGAIADYPRIEQTFSPVAINEIATWIVNQAK